MAPKPSRKPRKPEAQLDPEQRLRQARQRAVGWLSRREYAVAELAARLDRAGYEKTIVDTAVHWLLEHDLVSDQRFVEAFVRSRQRQGYGPMRVRAELRQRGISSSLADQALARAEEDWVAVARRASGKRFGQTPCTSLTERARRQQYLYRRGFDNEHIAAAAATRDDED